MKWKEIKEKYPKSYNKSQPVSNGRWFRYLYDFFDENEIYVEVGVYSEYNNKGEMEFIWAINELIVGCINELANGDSVIHKIRTEAETAAFTKAFEILEGKL